MSYFSFTTFVNKSDSIKVILSSTLLFFAFSFATLNALGLISTAVILLLSMYFPNATAIAPTSCT